MTVFLRTRRWWLLAAAAIAVGVDVGSRVDDAWAGGSVAMKLRAAERRVEALASNVSALTAAAERFDEWQACVRLVRVSEYGSRDGRFGYRYDAGDGTGVRRTSALAVDRWSRSGRVDFRMLSLSQRAGCRSAAPVSGGTAAPARVTGTTPPLLGLQPLQALPTVRLAAHGARAPGRRSSARRTAEQRIRRLERRLRRLTREMRQIKAAAGRFDAWESCLSWVPVTQYGDPRGAFGYLYGGAGIDDGYRTAISIDRTDWEDPDYRFLAFAGNDRPGRECADPGEGGD